MSSEEKLNQWAIIQLCMSRGHTPVQTMEMLNRSNKKQSVVRFLCTNFINGAVKDGKRYVAAQCQNTKQVTLRHVISHFMIPNLKSELKGKHFNDLDGLRSEKNHYPKEWFDQVGQYQWIERHRKCIAPQGAYFKKTTDVAMLFENSTCGTSLNMTSTSCI